MSNLDFEKEQVTTEWLTSILVSNGFLATGEVSAIVQKPVDLPGIASRFYSLDVDYTKKSLGLLPRKILLKTAKPDFYYLADNEISFFNAIVSAENPLPLALCYGAEKIPDEKRGYILLADLMDTHHQLSLSSPPTDDQCKEIIEALVQIHAYGRKYSSFGEHMMDMRSEEAWRQYTLQIEAAYPQFVDSLGDRILKNRKKLYETMFERLPQLIWSRFSSPKYHTLVHNDVNLGNVLFPNNINENHCTILDWQFWNIGLGAKDLACMIVVNLHSEQRQRVEHLLLKFYFEQMQSLQIQYSWDELQTDYRVFILFHLLTPVFLHSSQVHLDLLWPLLERLFTAIDDLNCLELL